MKVIRPVAVVSGDIVSTTATEGTAAYNAGTNYAVAAEVLYQDFIYESLVTPNTGNTPDTSPTFWLRVRPGNTWAMFDSTVSTQTSATSPLNVVITPDGIVDAVAFLNISGASQLYVELRDTSVMPAEVVYTKTVDLDASIVTDWYEYFFAEFEFRTDVVLTDLPPYGVTEVEVELTGGGTVALGLMQIGNTFDVGATQLGVGIGIRDYSVKETDEFGNTIFVQRAFSKRMAPTVFCDNGKLSAIFRVLSSLRAVPTVYIGTEAVGYDPLIQFGFLKDWNIEVTYPTACLLSMDIEGLT